MPKNCLLPISTLIGLGVSLLTSCQTTYSALPAAGGFGAVATASESSRPVLEEPKDLVASGSTQPFLVTPAHPQKAEAGAAATSKKAIPRHALHQATGLQTPSPDTLLQKQAEAPRKFGVTQGAHIAGGALVLAGGITTISGFNSNEPGWEPFAIVVLGVILAIIGGAMLLFKGKTARRRQKQA